jgi:hypothetical protein
MTDVDTLIRGIDQILATEVEREKANWVEVRRENCERGTRLERYEAVAKHVIDLLKPRLDAFVERFRAVVKAEPRVREHSRAMTLKFASTVANVTLLFEVFPDGDVSHVSLECTTEIIPVWVREG